MDEEAFNDRLQLSEIARMSVTEAESAIRARVQVAYLGEGRVLARVLGSFNMFLSGDDVGFGCHLMLDGYWESWLTVFFARYVKPGMTVIDVGANFGYYTLLFAGAVGASGRVIAIEPVPATVAPLHDSIVGNGFSDRTRLIDGAVGAVPSSQVHMLVPQGEPKNAAVTTAAQEGSILVPSFTIDELVADLDRVDLVKIDAEGMEEDVIAGMRQTIAKHRPAILLEFNAARYLDPVGFLDSLLAVYGTARYVGLDAKLEPLRPEMVATNRFGEDWFLFFA